MEVLALRIAVCDDNKAILSEINETIESLLKAKNKEAEIVEFCSSEQLLMSEKESSFDLFLLDIEIDEMNGFELADKLRSLHKNPFIIFISNFEQRVYQSYEFDPIWFIRKCDMEQMLPKAFNKFFEKVEEKEVFHEIKTGANKRTIRVSDIVYFECSQHRVTAVSTTENFSFYGSLRTLEKEFDDYGYIRIHKNFLVNKHFIFSIDLCTVRLLEPWGQLPLSREKRSEIKRKLFERS